MSHSFRKKIASSGYHVYRHSTWKNIKENQNCTFSFETKKKALTVDPYSIALQILPRDHVAPITVGHIPKSLSRFVYFFKKRGGVINVHVQTTKYRPSPIPEGGLEITLMVTFTHENEDTLGYATKNVNLCR